MTMVSIRSSRPTRPNHVLPPLGDSIGVSFDNPNPFASGFSNPSGYLPLNRSGAKLRGRGRGRGRGWWSGRQGKVHENEPYTFQAEKLDGLKVREENPDEGNFNFDVYEDIPVEATGSDIPPSVNAFSDIDLGEGLNKNIKRCKYVKPTPVQRHAIPIAVAGRDLMACAQTGSGKTAAFCFPILRGVLKGRSSSEPARGGRTVYPTALILSPTRELSCQIHDEATKFAYQTGVKIAVAYGGAPIFQQLRKLERGVDILVATPGRLIDMIEKSSVSLERIKYLAIDEADRMLDMGFEPQIRKIVMQMGMPRPGTRQTMLFSATFPDEIQRLASDFLSNYIFLSVGRVGSSTELIQQKVELVQDMEKRNCLLNILHYQKSNGTHGKGVLTLVFVETKRGADALERWLCGKGFPAIAIHGDKVQLERERALKSFKCGATPILVATDVASRGLDVPHVGHVINFDLPKDIDDYVHRIGRTGRAGKSGLATAFFCDKNQPLASALVELMQESNQEVPSWLSELSETSSSYCGGDRVHRYENGKFGGYDYRNGAEKDTQHYNSYSTSGFDYPAAVYDAGSSHVSHDILSTDTSSSFYNNSSAVFYGSSKGENDASYEFGYSYGSVVATGWD